MSRSSSDSFHHHEHGTGVIPATYLELIQLIAASLPTDVGPAWLVGGAVRDLVLGRQCLDLDLIVTGSPERGVQAILAGASGHARLGRARLHDDPETWRVALGDQTIDLVPRGSDLEAELRRRDLTINAMAAPLQRAAEGRLAREDLIDPTGGWRDLHAGIVRATGPSSMVDDPLRTLRVARFAAVLNFDVDVETQEWTREAAPLLTRIAGERIAKELYEILGDGSRDRGLALLREFGCLPVILPELDPLAGMEQGGHHHLDALEHSFEVVRMLSRLLACDTSLCPLDPALLEAACEAVREEPIASVRSRRGHLALAALLHDIGKPPCRAVDATGRIRFSGHEVEGAAMARRIARRLRLTSAEVHTLGVVVGLHMRPCMLGASAEAPTPRALGRLVRAAGDLMPDVALLTLADRLGARGPASTAELLERQTAAVGELLALWRRGREPGGQAPAPLTGGDLMRELGLSEGPLVGELLAEISAAAVAGEVATAREALDLAAELLAQRRGATEADEQERADGQV
jgi:poly(A) polymerase